MDELSSGRLAPGTRVLDRFTVVSLLGARDASETYLATQAQDGSRVALRTLWLRGAGSWKRVELIEREAAALARLDHPDVPRVLASAVCVRADDGSIVGHAPPLPGEGERRCAQTPLHDGASRHRFAPGATQLVETPAAGRDDGAEIVFVLAKAFIEGETLAARVARGTVPVDEAVRIGSEVADVLAYLHARTPPIVHRDVKPSNVVLRRENGHVALIDFGSVADPARFGGGGSTVAGTYGYIAPEQVIGDASPKSDLYALGATLLAMLTGKPPTELPRDGLRIAVERVVPDATLARVLRELVAPEPRDRPRGAAEAATKLRALAAAYGARSSRAPAARKEVAATNVAETSISGGDDELGVRWAEVQARWDDEPAHDRFIAYCAQRDQLAFAGHCYRSVLDKTPGDPLAERGKQRILSQALALLATHAGPRRDFATFKKVMRVAIGFVTLVIAIVTIVYMVRR